MAEGGRLLVVRLTAIGDVIHALPAAAALRRHRPDLALDWLVDARAASILHGSPIIDRLMVLRGKGLLRRPWRMAPVLRKLRRHRYEAVFDLQGLIKSALMARVARTRVRVGFDRTTLREPAARAFYNRTVRPDPERARHVIARGLALVGDWLGHDVIDEPWEFPLMAEPAAEAYVAKQLPADDAPVIVLNPGAAWRTKQWPPGRFGELASRLVSEWAQVAPGLPPPWLMVTWGPGDAPLRDGLVAAASPAARERILTFATTLEHLLPLFRRAHLFVGGDTGPMQLAVAAGTPTVALFGPTWPHRNGPFAPADRDAVAWHELPCSGCYGRRCKRLPKGDTTLPECLDRLGVDVVLDAVRRRLAVAQNG